MERYEHGGNIYSGDHITLDFSVNLNPYGMPEPVKQALVQNIDHFETYPDPKCRALRAAIAASDKVPIDTILCGNGADDLIYRLCFALRPRNVLICAPTFSEYEKAAIAAGAEVRYHFLQEREDFRLTDRILSQITPETELLFLCSPNNPTGRTIPHQLLEQILKQCAQTDTFLLLDECFLDFTHGQTALDLMESHPQLLILRAFTKVYAMAGLRWGIF